MNERHRVHVPGEMREQVAHPGAALSLLTPFEGRFHQRPDGVLEKARLIVKAVQLLAVHREDCGMVPAELRINGLAATGLVIERAGNGEIVLVLLEVSFCSCDPDFPSGTAFGGDGKNLNAAQADVAAARPWSWKRGPAPPGASQ